MRARTTLRTATLTAVTALLVLPASPALAAARLLAAGRDDGDDPGPGLDPVQTLLIYVGIPAALFLVIALLVSAPSMVKGPRYRPGVGWWAAPVWFNGPDDAERAVRDAAGSSAQGGGASARW